MLYLPRILEELKSPDYIPLSVDRLAESLEIPQNEFQDFKREINQHLRQGTLVKLKKNRICLPRDADLVTGIILFRQSGSAIVRPDVVEGNDKREPLLVNAEDTWVAMHKDRVVARIHHDHRRFNKRKRKKQPHPSATNQDTARVIRILERANETLAGTLKRSRRFYFVIPDDPRIIQDILVPEPKDSGLKPYPKIDDKVVVRLAPWEQRHLNPEGEFVKVLGETHTPFAEYQAILHQYDLNPEFPEAVLREMENVPNKVPKSAHKDRLDLREIFTLTIDPQDAKDFDDALTLEKLDNGKARIGVHIADVSSYVQPGSSLDSDARKRGNSTYLVGTVIPMLPHALSNGICSLVEGDDRLTKSVFLTYSAKGELLETTFSNSIIRSDKRLTYEQAYAFMFAKEIEEILALPVPPQHQTGATGRPLSDLPKKELQHIRTTLKRMWKIASKLRKSRVAEGSLELDIPEAKIYVDEEGWADRIVRVDQDESHQLIEEFMLAANEAVAKALNHRQLPGIHRVHDKPDPTRLDDFADSLEGFGIKTRDLSNRKELNRILRKIKDHPQGHMLRIEFLKSMRQACYRSTPDGHFGLNKNYYTHFTSPIRRYADLVIHRLFARHLVDGPRDNNTPNYKPSKLAEIAQHLSLTEQNSTEAERESNKIKLLEFFERELKKKKKSSFDAVIMDVRNHGMFVELKESMAYGLVHVSTLRDDLYKLNDDNNALIGRRKGRKFFQGQVVQVQVARVDRFKRQIDFQVAD